MPRTRTRPAGRSDDKVFDAIVDAIQAHRLPPGTKLKERELAEIFDVSRGAVRSALSRLGHSLLVELRPNRGAVIAHPSAGETRDVFEARRVIEGAVLQRLARNLSAKQVAELRAFVTDESRAYGRGDEKSGERLSIRFHKLLSELAGNAALDQFMEHLIRRTPLLTLAHRGPRVAYCGADEHREIVEALSRKDGALAVRRMTAHLTNLESQLRLDEDGAPAQISLSAALST